MMRVELKQKHGTPVEFARAVKKACCDLFITWEEAEKAIIKYQKEWERYNNLIDAVSYIPTVLRGADIQEEAVIGRDFGFGGI